MNNNELRYAKLGVLVNKLQKNGITDEQLNGLTVGFSDSAFNDLLFGIFTSSSTSNISEQNDNLKVFGIREVSKVLGGVDYKLIRQGTIPGISYNSDGEDRHGSATVNMLESWIIKYGITTSDFESGNERFIKSNSVKSILRYADVRSVYSLFKEGKPMSRFSMRVGNRRGLWLYHKHAVEYYKDNRTAPSTEYVAELTLLG
jgi:hypothetical protein